MKPILVILAFVALHLSVLAAPASDASAERLLEVMNARATVEGSYGQAEKMMRSLATQSLGGRQLSEQEQKDFETTISKTMVLMKEELTWDRLKPDLVSLYVGAFDQEEIDSLVAFYRSPAGQAFIRKMPIVLQKSMEITQAQMQRLLPRMKKIAEESARK